MEQPQTLSTVQRGPPGATPRAVPKRAPSEAPGTSGDAESQGNEGSENDEETRAAVRRAWVIFAIGCFTVIGLLWNVLMPTKKAKHPAFRRVYAASAVVFGVEVMTIMIAVSTSFIT